VSEDPKHFFRDLVAKELPAFADFKPASLDGMPKELKKHMLLGAKYHTARDYATALMLSAHGVPVHIALPWATYSRHARLLTDRAERAIKAEAAMQKRFTAANLRKYKRTSADVTDTLAAMRAYGDQARRADFFVRRALERMAAR
jgi:hypothetical protein